MQTFLPHKSFKKTFSVLDYRRLGKQRVEAKQIWNIITGRQTSGWIHHPAVRMWQGYHHALALYHNLCIEEWIRRGYNNNMPLLRIYQQRLVMPPWMGSRKFHASHRQTLLWKNPEHYSQFGWKEEPKYEYVWPA